MLPTLVIVVPCFNESAAFPFCLKALSEIIDHLINQNKIASNSYILFSDDNSQDDTWKKISAASKENNHVQGIKLSINKGHQLNLIAGLTYAHEHADITISIDADLQDDINAIEKMVDAYISGNEIVYGVRDSRKSDSYFKRITAHSFYKFMRVMGVEQVFDHADFRLLSKRALAALLQYQEQNLYIRGIIPSIGFKTTKVYYNRTTRIAGESKYPLRKMISLALTGITSFTITPLRIISATGLFMCFVSLFASCYVVFLKITGQAIVGWASTVIIIIFCCGMQMLSLGVIGEYMGKIYLEVKGRPRFFIDQTTSHSFFRSKEEAKK